MVSALTNDFVIRVWFCNLDKSQYFILFEISSLDI